MLRLIIVLTFFCILKVSASANAQQINLNLKDAPMEVAFREIKKQTGFGFWYEKEDIKTANKITIVVKNMGLKETLDQCFKDQPYTYEIFDRTIVVKRKTKNFTERIRDLIKDHIIKGKVTDEKGNPLQGVTIKIKGKEKIAVTNNAGEFSIEVPDENSFLQFNYMGFASLEYKVKPNEAVFVKLKEQVADLEEVAVVSTGYQTIPKERATGSFTQIDNKTINRAVSPDLLSRLKGITNGLLFDNNTGNATGISVRGRSTIFSNTTPLIVVDNFPFEGDLNSLNPNDVESVTLLKDAAAASIWGVRAGNGVIVVTTKKGRLNQIPTISLNTNLTIGNKPNLYYQPQLSSSEFIDIEKYLFEKGAYTATIANGYSTISPVVALLQRAKLDPAFSTQANMQIDALRNLDVREQQNEYLYRKSTQQQYYLNFTGGSPNQSYHFSAGYDKNLPNSIQLSNSRLTLKGNNSYNLLNNKLKLNTDIAFSKSKSNNQYSAGYSPYLPYDQIADENGNPLPVARSGGLRSAYTDTAGKSRLLDWKYRPLEEIQNGYSSSITNMADYRLNLGASYKISKSLNASINYQYYNANKKVEDLNSLESFTTRNMINTYSRINTSTGVVTRPIPLGSIYSPTFANNESNYGRSQLDFSKLFGGDHEISAILGFEIRDDNYKSNTTTLYGYYPETATNTQIDYLSMFNYYYGSGATSIGNNSNQFETNDRNRSLYGNASYIYKGKYILSGSYRKDESNLFGVKANQKGVPLWSSGLAWNIQKENFFNVGWISSLQLKATYGYNGNVNKSVSAYLTGTPTLFNRYGVQYYSIINPPNDNLRWERVQNTNLGLYFATKNDRITGSIEYYIKNGVDLIASSPIAPQTGISLFTGNTADTKTKGIDIQINAKLIDGDFKWNAVAIFNHLNDRITDYKVAVGSNSNIVTANTKSLAPLVGYPINSIFSFKWAGLDGAGNPQGYLNGAISKDYTQILNSNDPSQLRFSGSATPTHFGSIRNIFSYRNFELSMNIIYKFSYFFRRNSINYRSLFGGGYQQSDYANRWQNPGDELVTNVPSLTYPFDGNRGAVYQYSSSLIEHGDHVRLQDIQLNYNFSKANLKSSALANLNVYIYATNLGLLWKYNKYGLDPDFVSGYPNPRTIAFGVKTNF